MPFILVTSSFHSWSDCSYLDPSLHQGVETTCRFCLALRALALWKRTCLFVNSFEILKGNCRFPPKTQGRNSSSWQVLTVSPSFPFLSSLTISEPIRLQGDVWICMELMDTSLDKFYKQVIDKGQTIPEDILGKIAVSVSTSWTLLRGACEKSRPGVSLILYCGQPLAGLALPSSHVCWMQEWVHLWTSKWMLFFLGARRFYHWLGLVTSPLKCL